jgi:S1-C subfamily serine protease
MEFKKSRVTLSFTWHVLLISLLFLFALICGALFGGYKLYEKVLATESAQKEILAAQETERRAKDIESSKLLEAQSQELIQTKQELQKTKTDAQKTTAQVATLTETLKEQTRAQKDTVISSGDLALSTTGVVQVICSVNQSIISGSGSLFTFKEVAHAVLTNYHVVKDASRCVVIMTNASNSQTGVFALKPSVYSYNSNTDEAVLDIGSSLSSVSVPIENYNYSLSRVKKCVSPVAVGTPVVIIGFPAYAKRDATITIDTIGTVNTVFRTATNGIISGYDTSAAGAPNYFVSAKIDNGNSGGIALAKDSSGLCNLGLPTWLTVGNYETQGLVQNIMNVLPLDN